jgi:radical SAM protein with 4Fe4S-binding SPASM domain
MIYKMNLHHRLRDFLEKRTLMSFSIRPEFPFLDIRNKRFLDVNMDTTNQCNLRCRMCYLNVKRDQPTILMDTGTFSRIANHIFPYAKSLTYSCDAEALTNPHFIDFICIGGLYNVPITDLSTNGHLLTPEISEAIVREEISIINVSIDACTDKTYRIVRRNPNFGEVIENVKMLVQAKKRARSNRPDIYLAFVMMWRNIEELPGFVKMARGLGVQGVRGNHVVIFKGGGMRDEVLNKHKELTNRMLSSAKKIAEAAGLQFFFPAPFTLDNEKIAAIHNPGSQCTMVHDTLFVAADGRVYPCPWLKDDPFWGRLGNARDQSLRDIWFGERFEKLRHNLKNNRLSKTCFICPQMSGIGDVDDDRTFQEV